MKKGIDYIGVGVGAIIFNTDGKVFLARRDRKARSELGKWEFPGGGVEFGETLEHAEIPEGKLTIASKKNIKSLEKRISSKDKS